MEASIFLFYLWDWILPGESQHSRVLGGMRYHNDSCKLLNREYYNSYEMQKKMWEFYRMAWYGFFFSFYSLTLNWFDPAKMERKSQKSLTCSFNYFKSWNVHPLYLKPSLFGCLCYGGSVISHMAQFQVFFFFWKIFCWDKVCSLIFLLLSSRPWNSKIIHEIYHTD